ncbi:MAG: hypothetical protein ACHQC8_04360 [Solirubrobacterales bacterium]
MATAVAQSTISALVGARASWKTTPRTGDVEPPPAVEPSLA